MNKVILLGRLTKDVEIRYGQGESSNALARFTLAVDRKYKRDADTQSADFISCVAFAKTAEFLGNYGKKGMKFAIEGRIQTGSYDKDGQKVYTTDVIVESAEFAESKSSTAGNNAASSGAPSGDGFLNMPDDIEDMPFN